MTKAAELEGLDDEELEQRLSDAKQELFNLRFKVVTGQFDNTARLGYLKKDVARILTILRHREIEAAEAADAAPAAVPQETA
jgi:large subunit ribosomal protein L29